ncbi:MAG: DUF167 domain-containing protein [Phycisphaerales bacterium]|nr:DUF167 domain-containing protein [Phycisphaerales bacterium]
MPPEDEQRGCTIRLKVVPGSSRSAIAGWLGERLKVRVAAPPEAGKANEAVRRLLAEALGVPPRQVAIIAGESTPEKTVLISGVSAEQAARRLPR